MNQLTACRKNNTVSLVLTTPSSESEQNQPWSVNGIHLTRIQTDQNPENVKYVP